MKKGRSLRRGINLIVLCLWLIIFVMQSVYIIALYHKTHAEAQATFEKSMEAAHSVLERKVQAGEQLSKLVANDMEIAEYFQCNDAQRRQTMWNTVTALLQSTYLIAAEQYCALSFDPSLRLIDASGGVNTDLVQAAREAYAFYAEKEESLVFYMPSDTTFNDMFFFLFYDIKIPSANYIGMDFLGTIAVAGKVNQIEFMRQAGFSENVRLVLRYNGTDGVEVVLMPGVAKESHAHFLWKQSINTTNWRMECSSYADTYIPEGFVLILMEIIFMSALFFGMQRFINSNIFSPLYKISDFLQQYSLTQKNKRIHLQNQTEIGRVADKIDEMIDDTEQLSRRMMQTQQKLYESEIAQKEASLYALQSQLNPHFMYNTLDCICGIANVSGVPQIADVAVALAKMLRYGLSEKMTVPLYEEIEIVKNYLSIMEVRRPNFFTTEYVISEEAEALPCPKMLLQPIIENTFKHGFNTYVENARIVISAKVEDDGLVISIFDNGRGIAKEKAAAIQQSLDTLEHTYYIPEKGAVHIGLINIQNRIRLKYGNEYGLLMESEEGKFTKIILRLPKHPTA